MIAAATFPPASTADVTSSSGVETRLLLVGVPDRQVQALLSAAQGTRIVVETLAAAECDGAALSRLAPHVMLVPIWSLATIAGQAATAAIPVVALNLRAKAIDWTMTALDGAAAISATDIVSDPRAALDTALRVASSARLDGAVALVLPGAAHQVHAARRLAARNGLQPVTIRTTHALDERLTELQPAVVIASDGTPSDVRAAVAAMRDTADRSFLLLHVGDEPTDAAVPFDCVVRTADAAVGDAPALGVALERLRVRRVRNGRHVATNLRMPRALQSHVSSEWREAWTADAARTAIVIRPGECVPLDHWSSEVRRIATRARDAFGHTPIGYDDDGSLILIVRASAIVAERTVSDWIRLPVETGWSAGIADSAETGAQDYLFLRACAREALSTDAPTPVRRWCRDIAAAVPDVIVIEPDAVLSDMLQYGLRSRGHTCRALDTGSDALAVLRRLPATARPILVVTEVELAGIDGHSLHERLGVERPGAFDFVFLSNHAAEGEQLRALGAGARDYLCKPISVRVLLARLTRLLRDN